MKTTRDLIAESVFALALIASIAGCTHGSFTKVDTMDSCQVDVFDDSDTISKEFDRICLIEGVSAPGVGADIEDALKMIKNSACKCGADAVIIEGINQNGVNTFQSFFVSTNRRTVGLTAWGIKYKK